MPQSSADPGVEAAKSPLSDRLSRGVGVAGVGYVITRGITFATYIVLAQLIVPSDAGQLVSAQILIGMGFVFAESGMLAALIHWKGDIDAAASTAALSSVVTGIGLSFLGLATAPVVGLYFQSSTIAWVAAASAGLLLLRSFAIVPDALLQRRFAFVRRVTVDPVAALAHAVVAIGCCAAGLGVWGLLLGQYALYFTQAAAGWGLLRWRPRRRLMSFATWRQLAGYARHVVASEVVRRSTGQLDAVLLGRAAGANALGQYAFGLRIAATPIEGWISVANYALLPAFARIADDGARFRRAFVEALAALVTAGLPLSLLLLVIGDDLAAALLGQDWPQSGQVISALCGLGIGQMLTSISGETFKAASRPELLTRLHSLAACATVVALPAGLLLFANDVVGVAVAVSVVAVLTGIYAVRRAIAIVGASSAEVARSLAGVVVAAAIGTTAAAAADVLLPAATDRTSAAAHVAIESTVLFVVFVPALRVLAPAAFSRVVGAVAKMRPAS